MKLTINESFNRLLGKLSEEEVTELEASILSEGVRDPIVTWKGTIIDGHNRYRIATKHGLPFKTTELQFDSELDAQVWIIANQFARRNLTEEMKAYLRGKRYEVEKELHGGDRKSEAVKKSKPQNGVLINTTNINASRLADEHNVSKNTIVRDADYSVGIDALSEINREDADTILSGKSDLTKSQVQEIGKVARNVTKEVEREFKEKEAELKKRHEQSLKEAKQKKDKLLLEETQKKERQRLEEERRKEEELRRRQSIEAERRRQKEEAERKEEEKRRLQLAKLKEEEKRKEEERRLQKRAAREKLANEGAKKSIGSQVDFRLGDFEEVFSDLPDGSVDCIITDPPYPKEYLDCWDKLGRFAKRVLKPNGFCIAYSGQMHLPEVFSRLGKSLDYYWTFAVYHEGQTQIVNGVNLICRWKPVLIYQNGKKKLDITIQDYFISESREKSGHDWQQSESGIAYLIDRFTMPGDVILDPFAGSGTTLVVAKAKQRIAKGAEIDKQHYDIAKTRL